MFCGETIVPEGLSLINFAHGDVFMVAGLMAIYLSATLPLYVAMPLVVVLTVVLGFSLSGWPISPCAPRPV